MVWPINCCARCCPLCFTEHHIKSDVCHWLDYSPGKHTRARMFTMIDDLVKNAFACFGRIIAHRARAVLCLLLAVLLALGSVHHFHTVRLSEFHVNCTNHHSIRCFMWTAILSVGSFFPIEFTQNFKMNLFLGSHQLKCFVYHFYMNPIMLLPF